MTLQGIVDKHERLERTLANPLAAMCGRPYRFRGGFTIDDRNLGETLARLAWHGVVLGGSGASDHSNGEWIVDQAEGTIEIPTASGHSLAFSLKSVDATIFLETFLYDVHFIEHDLRNWVILDAGAYVGDTALYYASRGAMVLALEPNPVNLAYLNLNLKLNPELARQIKVWPVALVGSGKSSVRLWIPGTEPFGGSAVSPVGDPVRATNLADCIRALRSSWLRGRIALKLDIKGEEYSVAKCPELAKFDHVQIEYGSGATPLLAALELAGFGSPRLYRHNFGRVPLTRHGIVSASKRVGE